MAFAIALILSAIAYRVVGAIYGPDNEWLFNFAPMMALAYCGAIYLKRPWGWLVPMAGLLVSDIALNLFYGVAPLSISMLDNYLCYALAFGLGVFVARKKSWATLLGGAFASSLLFYVVTNTFSWLGEPAYAKSIAGWWQALTVGLPGFMPTVYFFRQSLTSDLLFTATFAVVMEWQAAKLGLPSLFGRRESAIQIPATR